MARLMGHITNIIGGDILLDMDGGQPTLAYTLANWGNLNKHQMTTLSCNHVACLASHQHHYE